ncbi:hypothetical protein ACOME3_006372 [Neoechinorhynchus agilis]
MGFTGTDGLPGPIDERGEPGPIAPTGPPGPTGQIDPEGTRGEAGQQSANEVKEDKQDPMVLTVNLVLPVLKDFQETGYPGSPGVSGDKGNTGTPRRPRPASIKGERGEPGKMGLVLNVVLTSIIDSILWSVESAMMDELLSDDSVYKREDKDYTDSKRKQLNRALREVIAVRNLRCMSGFTRGPLIIPVMYTMVHNNGRKFIKMPPDNFGR